MDKSGQGIGRCKCAFWFAVCHDILGLLILLSGVFWNVFCNDLLIYVGAVIIFLSLIWWVFWYTGNIEVPPSELDADVAYYSRTVRVSDVVQKVSDRLSNGLRISLGKRSRVRAPSRNSHLNNSHNTEICMISFMNTPTPAGISDNLKREPLSV